MSRTFEIEAGRGLLAWACVPARDHDRPHRSKSTKQCGEHGLMERVDPDAVEIEKNGVVWEIDGWAPTAESNAVELHYCPGCLDEELRTHDRMDASDMELLGERIAEEWTNQYRRGQLERALFSVREVTDEATPEFCPYCSDDLETVAEDVAETVVECSVHGRFTIDVRPAEVPSP